MTSDVREGGRDMAETQAIDRTAATMAAGARDRPARPDPITAALEADKREGLLLAVKARWVALLFIGPFLVSLNPTWSVLYYEVLLAGFALIGWLQIKVGRLGKSPMELALIFCDLGLMTVALVLPNPFWPSVVPLEMQYHLGGFSYFFIFLAGATLAYSWRTVLAYGVWTGAFWILGLVWVSYQPATLPEISAQIQTILANYPHMLEHLDPNDPQISRRVQEIFVFMIAAGILALAGRRTNNLLRRQAAAARERANLARHFPPNIADQLAHRDQPLGAVRDQDVAVMFVDIVGFTHFAEHREAGEVVGTLREFHSRMETAVFDHNGTLEKFLGDGLMVTFGTPEPGPRDASNALACAEAMVAAMDQWNTERGRIGAEPIRISIGVHFGRVVLGDIGSERRLEFAVLGDAVNVASRLEHLTRELGVRVAVSGDLVAAFKREAGVDAGQRLSRLDRVDSRALRGREDATEIWTL
jgi:adenylate cyclase